MSCIRFNTPAQRAQLDRLRADKQLADTAVAQFLGPEFGETKINRLRIMAEDKNPKIRESVALSYHVPEEVMWALAKDKNEGVRICVARNETTPCDILRYLASDKSEQVRSWVAVNFFVPQDTMEALAGDQSESVRKLVAWKADLAEQELVSQH
ncbi:hypothetical protein M2119_001150 [Aurantimicrobium minutum]|uniref:hypothetical protein n=1 Tax=Aurantimicrobium minutum TaxID=708131 RepID=UPI002475D2A6|nr:hypothetical protein [Aurantimicrobium minutum]MDH6532913.1 hypothetical protein [Aurantimicrobium minutum]